MVTEVQAKPGKVAAPVASERRQEPVVPVAREVPEAKAAEAEAEREATLQPWPTRAQSLR